MKKIAVFALLLIATFSQAQNYQFIDQIKSLPNQENALSIATEIASNSTSKLRLYKAKDFPKLNKYKVVFVPAQITDQDIENYNVSDADKQKYVTFVFAGASGKYWLTELTANYQDMFVIWKKYFKADAEPEKTAEDYASQHLKETDKKINFYIQKSDPVWILHNQS